MALGSVLNFRGVGIQEYNVSLEFVEEESR